ncbi:UDP-N-acetylmuramoyl-tripeptide--D-alanyl-D-alanine ligase [Leptospira sp. 2 VSF19]|uniref:UDP-N-acetylmuramoyl-tripeptide--D-alanyl-D-alanine ligase n=1 Tax=Leptospira soteropolitanensis TaxID=2950025 RepID=A0AAW5VLQ4_9LEPT|nr:UDP-N-acetylmuramoyl-tripeptide--D-alanyl-D-alanine ligase [Leptospira soteropolitanensis]MCW7492134.1 UDP-N-acetylmuramoyl-tripeptide--D-alanyl-D-alanine ligase [Leptospira soteropolitanensis]MCW7499716.1 UDP-N-acetylmuramoyl-tripeptide--D-alanyl-D-alanine ligase [Leptospira soteropolitanensis]MCW7521967.1 UDP-N-acetylmuramoyl-tripeptide--D-alanyl-D-alanine ligase [Leptospira soteropolitanensis]MCW7525821.1 UDP-N-acetylmuramoyl-tripeptide--D-alanyl-D-alanine ligase [Leptospira soteropolitan
MIAPFEYSLSTILSLFSKGPHLDLKENLTFRWITTSSVEAKPRSLFIPLRGTRDGHEFIPDALAKGAIAFLCEKNHPILKQLSTESRSKAIIVSDSLKALGLLARYHRNRFNPIVLTVTGSSGKTTTKDLLGGLFGFLNRNELVVTEKNYNNEIGLPFTLFRINEKTRVAICELGMNHRGEISRLSEIALPTHALITNIGSAHIENLKSREAIAEEKIDIICGMKPNSVLFVPDDLDFLNRVKIRTKKQNIQLVVWNHKDKPVLKVRKTQSTGFQLDWKGTGIQWKLPGSKLLSNVRGMVAVGVYFKIPSDQISKTIQNYKSPDKRLNINKGYFTIIDDCYNANPESMLSSIGAAEQFAGNRNPVWILGSMKELGKFTKYYHEEIGKEIRRMDKGILLGFGDETKPMVKKVPGSKHFTDVSELIEFVKSTIPKNSVLLVKGSRSMKMERIVQALERFKG